MFEGLVQNLLLGYLGSYVKNLRKDQLKIGPWNGEVKLHNLELNLEAFDNLQLPFSLKQGRIGTLRIKIPWKKLGWDPIEISLDNVFVRACERDDEEWSAEAVERREYAAKKAKLHAAEMAKPFVSETKIWQSFIPHVTAKILDGIQVSIKHVHFIYTNKQSDLVPFIFGLRFSSLIIRSTSGKQRGAEVNKSMMISSFEIYCSASQRTMDAVSDSQLIGNAREKSHESDILEPCDVTVSFVVNRHGQLEDGFPQYSVSVELTSLVLRLNEIQLQQILILCDYFGTCPLREKYGRFRPCYSTLCSKPEGWQKAWWNYAQQSVLSDIYKRLRKTSWKYLGRRITYRRNYVRLYKKKLNFIRQAQPVDNNILGELEQMERESDVEDILTYRSIAELEPQEFLLSSSPANLGKYSCNVAAGPLQIDEGSSAGARGWINWLSLGMLGAGGAEDSIQFSGVVSDEIVKDIYEVTQFHPMSSLEGGALTKNGIFLVSITFSVHQVNVTLLSKTDYKEAVKICLDEVNTVFKFWEESWNILIFVNSLEMDDQFTGNVILLGETGSIEKKFFTLEIDMSSINREPELSVKVVFEPFEVNYEPDFVLNLQDFYLVLTSFQFQSKRVLLSLNGFENDDVRLLSKVEYIFSNRMNVTWKASFGTATIKVPWRDKNSEFIMVINIGALVFRSSNKAESSVSASRDQPTICLAAETDMKLGVQLDDLYDYFDVLLSDFEVNIMRPDCCQTVSIFDRCSSSVTFTSCIIPDESVLRQMEVYICVSSLSVHFSPSIYCALLGMISILHIPKSRSELEKEPRALVASKTCIGADLKCIRLHVDFEDDAENSLALILAFGEAELDILSACQEVVDSCFSIKTVEISICTSSNESSIHPLCSSKNLCTRNSMHQSNIDAVNDFSRDGCGVGNVSAEGCFVFHYQEQRIIGCPNCIVYLNDLDLHIYPNIVGLLIRFFDRLSGYGTPSSADSCKTSLISNMDIKDKIGKSHFNFQKFGFSNFDDDISTAFEGIHLDHFPFITIHNSGYLGSLELSLIHAYPEWSKRLNPRDRKSVGSLKFDSRKRSRMFSVPNLEHLSQSELCPALEGSYGASGHVIDLNLNGVEVYFHDSSCILAAITLPLGKSSFIVQGSKFVDILCSVDGLLLSSCWATKDFGEFLWGSSVPNLSPTLNIRLKKIDNFEISISVQHVRCVLPSEFLAILIGYFSLPAWSPYGSEKSATENHSQMDVQNCGIIWKVEILDSRLILPVECKELQSLCLGLQRLYVSFTTMSHKEEALKYIPTECVIPAQKLVDSIHVLNIFGRDICLSLTLLKDGVEVSEKFDQDTGFESFSLISPLDLDLWIRIPCDGKCFGGVTPSTCIMTKIGNCQVIAEDDLFIIGVEALFNVISDFSAVGSESEGFKSDVNQFLQFKKVLKDSSYVQPNVSCVTFTELRCYANSLSISLHRSELVARVDMQFQVSASFRNETPLFLDVGFSSLTLNSLHSRVILVQCISDASVAFGFIIRFAKSYRGASEFLVDLPSVHVWLHLLDWFTVIEVLVSYSEKLAQASFMSASSDNSTSASLEIVNYEKFNNDIESPRMSSSSFRTSMDDSFEFIVRSEHMSVFLHYPLLVREKVFSKLGEAEINLELQCDITSEGSVEAAMLRGKYSQYVTLVLHSKDSELAISKGHAKLICSVEEASGILETVKEQRILCSSIFQLNQINVVILHDEQEKQHFSVDIRVDSFAMSVSLQLFDVWHNLGYHSIETGSSQNSSISMDLKVQLRKASLLLNDWTCSCNGPILEILLRNLVMHSSIIGSAMEASLAGDLLTNYFNIKKVMWEPFIETWSFLLNMARTHKQCSLLNTSILTDIHLTSTTQLNFNLTESVIEVIFRVNELIKRVLDQFELKDEFETHRILDCRTTDSVYTRRYAPYILQNETSLPLLFQVYRGVVNHDVLDILSIKEGIVVYPGSSVPIYTDESPEEQVLRLRPPQSSDRLSDKKMYGAAHHMISIQLDGTSGPSRPISMDVVGLSYFEVNFSKALAKVAVKKNEDTLICRQKTDEESKMGPNSGFVVPVVFDVSSIHYRKLIRVYSTVILLNTTSTTLELRFDTPFGVSAKVLDQISPGQEFPLPLHLTEAGRIRWRPLNSSFLWSEAHIFSKVFSQETRVGSFRSFVCHPSHPSSGPFRCCLSVQLINLASSGEKRIGSSPNIKETQRQSIGDSGQSVYTGQNAKTPSIHYVTLATPLLVRNYMPREVSLTIEAGGIARNVLISEVDCASIFDVDSSHDLDLVFHVHGFRNSITLFPRAEVFVAVARFNENKFSQSETLTFYPDSSNGPIYVTVEKTMDAFCGARELCIFVPFLLYNCTGLQITVADLGHEMEGCTMPPCDHLIEMDQHIGRKHSPILLSSKQDSYGTTSNIDNVWNLSSKNRSISLREHFIGTDLLSEKNRQNSSSLSHYFPKGRYGYDLVDEEDRNVKAHMYFPHSRSSASELMVRLSICMPNFLNDNKKSSVWSSAFYLIPASGSTCVVVPQTNTSGAFIVSVTSNPLLGPFSGRTRAITFQPRYIISNACTKDLSYKQKGTDLLFNLGVGQHSHLHWADPTRELLVSLKYNEPGWLWSGSFFPDHLGDTQVKMRNYVGGALSMIRVEVQNADLTIRDENTVGSPNGNSGTLLILISDDNTGFMPYRIHNFSKERLRIYQEKCKTSETTIHSYMSCPYTWDEPCYPHRLVVEVLGERILGSFTLDDVTESAPIYLPSTSEKPARQLFLSIHADGAVKVLSIMDSSYLPKDMKDPGFSGIKEKRRSDQKEDIIVDYCERISVHIPFVGVSVINSYPQELIFASAQETRIDLLQSVEQQKFSFQISSLQIDNQLYDTAYPVILSSDLDCGGNIAGQVKLKDNNSKMKNETFLDIPSVKSCQPILFLSAVKWRNKEISLIFFEYIILRLASLHLELEEEVILCLFNFVRSVTSEMQRGSFPCLNSTLNPVAKYTGSVKGVSVHAPHYESLYVNSGHFFPMSISKYIENCRSNPSLPSLVPIEDFWQQIHLSRRRQNRIHVELFILAPIKLTLSFSSAPWMLRNGGRLASAEYARPISGTAFQRGLMALADVEGAPVYLKQLTIAHHMGTLESFHEILIRHYTPQLLHEMYKIFGSASVIGNPMGFAKNLGLGIKDFLSVPTAGILKSPSGLFIGMAHGTTSLFSSTVYAISNAATQFSKSVHKGIVAFTFDDQALSTMEKQWTSLASHGKGVLYEFLEGLTGFLQSPIRGAEKHGIPGFLSGVALGTTGLVARPVASILEVTGKTAQSIRNRSRLHKSHRFRARFSRALSREIPLQPYSWEEAIGKSVLVEAQDLKLKNERFVTCRTLKQRGKFLIITERFVLVVMSSSMIAFGTPEFIGVSDPQWVIEFEMSLKNAIYVGKEAEQVNIVGIISETPLKVHQHKMGTRRTKWLSQATPLPLLQITSIELAREEEAENLLQVLVSTIELRKEQQTGVHILHQTNLR